MKRSSWTDYQKDIADDNYYYARSCIRQNFFPGSEKAFLNILSKDLGRNIFVFWCCRTLRINRGKKCE